MELCNIFMRYPEGRYKALTFSYDDGVPEDKRLADIFSAHGLRCTFNFNCESHRAVNFTREEIKEYFLDRGHEIAVHGAYHRANGHLRAIEGIREVLGCRLDLEERCGRIIRGMAYPNSGIRSLQHGTTYEQIKSYLKELDIAYARTLGGDNDAFLLPDDFYAWMPSAHHANPLLFEFIDKFLAIDYSAPGTPKARRLPRLLYIWGHSFEFERNNNWDIIERACEKLAGRDDIWYATNMEIYEYVEAYGRLVYSADGHRIYNPTLIELWFDADGVLYSVAPGETLCIPKN